MAVVTAVSMVWMIRFFIVSKLQYHSIQIKFYLYHWYDYYYYFPLHLVIIAVIATTYYYSSQVD